MTRRRSVTSVLLLALLAPVLAACGGGGGGSTTSTAPSAAASSATSSASPSASTSSGSSASPSASASSSESSASASASSGASSSASASSSPSESASASASASGSAGAGSSSAATGPVDYSKLGPELADAFAGKLKGKTVSISHGLSGDEENKFKAQFKDFQAKTGINVNLVSGGTVEAINVKVTSGTVEDIVNFPQPGTMAGYAKQGKIIDLNKVINQDWLKQNYKQGFIDTNTVADASGNKILGGVFNRINFKGAVWYPKKAFTDAGYQVPKTWDEMKQLMDKIVADGDTPWCVGIASGNSNGWPATDLTEQVMLRTTSLDNYDKWTKGDLKFTDPIVKNAVQTVSDIWFTDKYVYGGRKAIASTQFGDAPVPMFQDPPKCYLLDQGNFITTFFEKAKPGVKAGVDYDFFPLPAINQQYGAPQEFGGDLFSMFKDRPEVRAVTQYLTTYESIQPWIKAGGGALSPHNNANVADYTTDLDRNLAKAIAQAPNVRFDGSDLMPAEVGSGSFWKGMTDYVSGSANLDQALQTIQNGWNNVKK